MQPVKIYIDLDSIFDTRLATISELNEDAATALVLTDAYWHRESDHWDKLTGGTIQDAAFAERYSKRDNSIVQRSVMTGIIAPLVKVLAENEIAIQDGRPNRDISIEVNIYPYMFDDIEMGSFIDFFNYRLGFEPTITFVSMPSALLTPAYLTESFAAAFMYDFNGWIKQHLSNLIKNRTQGFNLIVPRLFEKDVTRLPVDDKKDQVATFRLFMLDYMNINFIDVAFFSMFRL